MKKLTAIIIALTLAASLCACSSKNVPLPEASQTMTSRPESSNTEMSAPDVITDEKGENNIGTEIFNSKVNVGAVDNRKIIYEAHLQLEAIDFDKATNSILYELQQLGGYVSSSAIEGQIGVSRRYAQYTFRIPQQNYSKLLVALSQNTNVLSQAENAQDITSEYVDIEARLKSLEIQEERLLEMMKSAGELETLLAIQNQLTDVQYRIESITAQKNTYDQLTQYATVNITLDEVYRITETQKETFIQKLGVAFRESWINFVDDFQHFVLSLIYLLPSLIVLVVVLSMSIFIFLKIKRKKKTIAPPVEQPQQKETTK